MFLITTPTGNTGRHVLRDVLANAAQTLSTHTIPVRVLVRDATRLDADLRSQCEVVEGDLHDPASLNRALYGVEAAFFCVPQSGESHDIPGYYRSFVAPFAEAAQAAGVKRIVAVSGGDGQEEPFEGIGEALHLVETMLASTGAALRYLRCGYFMENFFWMAEPIAHHGVFALPVAPDVPLPFVAARDIGAAAARLLLDATWQGQQGVGVHGPERLTCDQAAQVATEVLGFPVRFQPIPGIAYQTMLREHGVTEEMGRSLVLMFEAITAGRDMGAIAPEEVACPTTLRAWMGADFKFAIQQMRSREAI